MFQNLYILINSKNITGIKIPVAYLIYNNKL